MGSRTRHFGFVGRGLVLFGWALVCMAAASEDGPDADARALVELVQALTGEGASRALIEQAVRDRNFGPRDVGERLLRVMGGAVDEAGPRRSGAEQVEFFETRVRPILAERCLECHGPEKQEKGLRLDSREAIVKGTATGPVYYGADPRSSRLAQVVEYTYDVRMPPTGKLPEAEIEALLHWLDLGLPWGEARVIGPGTRVRSMEERMAQARQGHWAFQPVRAPAIPEGAGSPIDRLVDERLMKLGLGRAPEADRRTLVRRAYYDLVGLPPSFEEVEAFVNDPAPDAYERLIDRLLASPEYGERWGRYWLDVARYADTKGYVFNTERAFPYSHTYRDYVIRAFNEDLPYDEFIVQQLAADRLDLGEDKRPLAALGFLTLGRRFLQNPHDIADDRIDVVTRGLLGLTVSCARCHDHKYDPITSADYYALYGVFRSTYEPEELPLIRAPDPNDGQYQAFLRDVEAKEKAHTEYVHDRHVEVLHHTREKVEDYLRAAHRAWDMADEGAVQALAKEMGVHWQLVLRWREYLKSRPADDPVWSAWRAFIAVNEDEFAARSPEIIAKVAGNEPTFNSKLVEALKNAPPQSMDDVHRIYGEQIRAANARWAAELLAYAQSAAHGAAGALPAALADPALEALRLVLYAGDSPANVKLSEVEEFLDVKVRQRITDLRNAVLRVQSTHPGRPDRAMALYDADRPFDPYVFERGKPDSRGPDVPRRFLEVLAGPEPKPFSDGGGRLDLARAIADRNNPLTARVFVNRVWMHHFGRPLVETPSDFGLRSEPPAQPELLDYLAWRFMEDGWSVKKLHRLILLSGTYRQSSAYDARAYALDPDNRLLWRQDPRRLDFEAFRDSLLAVSGRLDLTRGGPSVDITEPPYPPRRSVYAFIERQNLPGMFRTFDFASPDAHSPRRYETTAPQQALYVMNNPFVIEQARALAGREEIQNAASDVERVAALYRLAYQRGPDAEETALALEFVARHGPPEAPPPPPRYAWQYGYGRYDEDARRVVGFTPLPNYGDRTWRGGKDLPDAELGWVSLRRDGGHPGRDAGHASIRRWVAPASGLASIDGKLEHRQGEGDGVAGYIVSGREGVLWSTAVLNAAAQSRVEGVEVREGDTIDFVVACREHDAFDTYFWAPRVRLTEFVAGGSGPTTEWDAQTDFAGPLPARPAPLEAWEELAQVLLMSNEFAFVD